MADPGEAELRALLGAAEAALVRAVAKAGLQPEVAAAACATLAGEYAAVVAAGRGLPPGPVLNEAERVLRRRGEAVHRTLRAEVEALGAEEGDAGDHGGPRRRPWRADHGTDAAGGSWFRRWRRLLGMPPRDRGGRP